MGATVTTANSEEKTWGGGNEPMGASYGKLMMWFFIVSDALTFSGFLAAYGFSRFKFIETWPLADEVFTHFPFMHGVSAPMYYVALMTFILIFSSVTMVLAVDAGHHLNKKSGFLYVLNHYWWFDIRWFSSLGMEKFHQRRIWRYRNQRWKLIQFVDKLVKE
jgi:cytochrome c oxidase subunit 3